MSEKRFTGKMLVATNGEEFGFTIYDEDKRMSIKGVVDLLNEQQATISQLQDLCGESDGENAKLRIENKRLQEENEQLRQKLDFYLLDEFEWKEKYGDD